MAGLLGDYTPDPLGQGLLGLGAALLTPRAMGGGIAAGAQAFNQNALMAQEMRRRMAADAERAALLRERTNMDREEFGFRRQRYQSEQDEAQRRQQVLGQVRTQIQAQNPELLPLFDTNPQAAMERLFPKPEESKVVAPGSAVVRGNQEIYRAPERPQQTPWEYEPDPAAPGRFRMRPEVQAAKRDLARAGASNVAVNTAFPKQMAAVDADLAKGDMTKWEAARSARSALRGIMQTSPGAASGPMANVAVSAVDFLSSLGVASEPLQKMSADSAQFNSQATELMLANIKKLGANPSNADREELSKMVPQITRSKAARDRVAQIMLKYTNRAELDAKHRFDYIQQNSGSAGWRPLKVNDMPTDKKALMPGAIYQHPVTQEIAVYKGNGQFETVVGDD